MSLQESVSLHATNLSCVWFYLFRIALREFCSSATSSSNSESEKKIFRYKPFAELSYHRAAVICRTRAGSMSRRRRTCTGMGHCMAKAS